MTTLIPALPIITDLTSFVCWFIHQMFIEHFLFSKHRGYSTEQATNTPVLIVPHLSLSCSGQDRDNYLCLPGNPWYRMKAQHSDGG